MKLLSIEGLEGKYPDVLDMLYYHEFEHFTLPRSFYVTFWVREFYIAYRKLVPKNNKIDGQVHSDKVGHG